MDQAAPAYVIAFIEVTNPEGYPEYAALTPGTLEPFGGHFIVRGGNHQVLEGSVDASRVVVIQFPSRAAAEAWWNSPEYEKAKVIRRANSRGQLVLVDGVAPQ